MTMELNQEEILKPDSQNSLGSKSVYRVPILNLARAQHFMLTWVTQLLSSEFWNIAWIWTSVLMKIYSFRIWLTVGSRAKRKLMLWVSSCIGKRLLEKTFPGCFKNGILLCTLMEKLVPGSCPRFELLDADQSLLNLKLALHLVKKHTVIKPYITPDEILQCGEYSAMKFLFLVAQLKLESEKINILSACQDTSNRVKISQATYISNQCFAKGLGLLLAARGRTACFTIFLNSIDDLDLVIEIRGPKNTASNKRIDSMLRSDSSDLDDSLDPQVKESIRNKRIPLTYRILGRKVAVNYTPLESGTHNMSIICQGQHIPGSPYAITVDGELDVPDIWKNIKRPAIQNYDESTECNNAKNLINCQKLKGKSKKKKILRYIVKLDGKDVIIDGKEDLCYAINKIKLRQENESLKFKDVKQNALEEPHFENNFAVSESENNDSVMCNTENGNANERKFSEDENEIRFDGTSGYIDRLNNEDIAANAIFDKSCRPAENYHESRFQELALLEPKRKLDALNDRAILDICNAESKTFSLMSFNHDPGIKSNDSKENYNTNSALAQNNSCLAEGEICEFQNNISDDTDFCSVVNSRKNSRSSNDDISLFPVHKVKYEILRDYDSDEIEGFNEKRRTSFTELNESNYLDDENCIGSDSIGYTRQEMGTEHEATSNIDAIHKDDSISNNSFDGLKKPIRASIAVFQCDHSLGFWSETIDESSDECAFGSISHTNLSEMWENKLRELESSSPTDDISFRFDSLANIGVANNVEDLKMDSDLNNLESKLPKSNCGGESAACISKPGNQIADEKEFPLLSETLDKFQDSFDPIKRLSWSDRDILPSIRESSIESCSEFEPFYNFKLKEGFNSSMPEDTEPRADLLNQNVSNKESDENILELPKLELSKHTNADKFRDQLTEMQFKAVTHAKCDTNTFIEGLSKSSKSIDELGNRFLSMNILSASPYKSRPTENEKCFVGSNFDVPSVQSLISNTVEQKQERNGFILTYANPVVIHEASLEKHSALYKEEVSIQLQRITTAEEPPTKDPKVKSHQPNHSADNFNNVHETADSISFNESKSVQCLSVKKVMQIFQREKEEPLDVWPSESQKLLPFYKKNEQKNLSSLGMLQFSIKDRVKLFEKDQSGCLTETSNLGEKQPCSKIATRKNYWEKKIF